MFSRQRLFWLHQPYDLEGSDPDFLRAVRDNCAFHMARCPEYRAIADHIGFSPEQIQTIADLARLPVLPTPVLQAARRLFHAPVANGHAGHLLRHQRQVQPGGL